MTKGSHRRALIGKSTNSNQCQFFFVRRFRTSTPEDGNAPILQKGVGHPIGSSFRVHSSKREVKTQSLAPPTCPASEQFRARSSLLCALMRTPKDFLYTGFKTHCPIEKEVTSLHNLNCFHMHFHGNPTDPRHHIAHEHDVSLGSTTPLRTSSHTARSTIGYQAELLPSRPHGATVEWFNQSIRDHADALPTITAECVRQAATAFTAASTKWLSSAAGAGRTWAHPLFA